MIQKALDDLAETGIALNGFSFFTPLNKTGGIRQKERRSGGGVGVSVKAGRTDGRIFAFHSYIDPFMTRERCGYHRCMADGRALARRVVELRWIRTVALVCVSLPRVYRSGSQSAWVGWWKQQSRIMYEYPDL